MNFRGDIMFCPECGTKILDNSVYCSECGTKIVRTPETSVETKGIVARKEPEKPAVDSFTPYKGLIVCAVIMLLSALILPIYYYEGGTKLSIFLLGFKEIDRHFGIAFEEPLIRCNTIVFACLALTSITNIALAYKRKHKGTMFCFLVALCAMIVYPIYVYDNLPDLNTVRTVSIGFFVIIITIIVGIVFSYKCSKVENLKESGKTT